MLEGGVIRFQRVFELRWLSLGHCISALIRNYQPLMAVLAQPGALHRGVDTQLPASDGCSGGVCGSYRGVTTHQQTNTTTHVH